MESLIDVSILSRPAIIRIIVDIGICACIILKTDPIKALAKTTFVNYRVEPTACLIKNERPNYNQSKALSQTKSKHPVFFNVYITSGLLMASESIAKHNQSKVISQYRLKISTYTIRGLYLNVSL